MLFGSRPVDRRRARQIQIRKREDLSGECGISVYMYLSN